MDMDYKTIYTSPNPAEVALIKHALVTEGIPFHITNEGLLHSLGIAVMGNSGSDIQVPIETEAADRKLLCGLDLVC